LAEDKGATPAQIILAWHLAAGTIVIPKSSTPARMRENLAAANISLTAADLESINALDAGTRVGADPAVAAHSQF
jgi:diketogulonate reductase-like aldo/keto reductase